MTTDLPTLTTMQAITQRVRNFNAPRACKACGSHERYLSAWGIHYCSCVGCEVAGGLSKGAIKAAEGQHNRKVAKNKRDNWSIPRVFSGLNTSTR